MECHSTPIHSDVYSNINDKPEIIELLQCLSDYYVNVTKSISQTDLFNVNKEMEDIFDAYKFYDSIQHTC